MNTSGFFPFYTEEFDFGYGVRGTGCGVRGKHLPESAGPGRVFIRFTGCGYILH